jgi:hypothetical protein
VGVTGWRCCEPITGMGLEIISRRTWVRRRLLGRRLGIRHKVGACRLRQGCFCFALDELMAAHQ